MHDRLFQRWNSISLRTKMTGVSVFLLTLGLLASGLGSMYVLKSYLTFEVVDEKVTSVMKQLMQERESKIIIFDQDSDRPECTVATGPTEVFYIAVLDIDGNVLCSNRDGGVSRPDQQELSRIFFEQDSVHTVASSPGAGQWRVSTANKADLRSGVFVYYTVGLSLNETDALIARYSAIFLFFGLTVIILGGALTRILVTSTFNPLREVEATAARFAAGDFSQRMGDATPNTEVGRLNRSLNSMLSRIDSAFADRARTIDQMRRFVGDASHELRTPLVSVRGYAELYRMGALQQPDDVAQAMQRIEKEAIRMGELVSDLLELARIDEAKPLQLAAVDLIPLARDASLDAMAASPEREVTVVVTVHHTENNVEEEQAVVLPAPIAISPTPRSRGTQSTGAIAIAGATLARLRALRARSPQPSEEPSQSAPLAPRAHILVSAEENKIRQVLTNLIGNAVRFTPKGSPIEIGVEVDESASLAILSVIDHGEGIPEQVRDKIFQRFWRADSSRNRDTGGSGLGLAIVQSIVAAHRGEVHVIETPGGGATFRVLLPLLQQAEDAAVSTDSKN